MTVYVMLTLDLNGHVSTESRDKFYGVLMANHFHRRKLTTTWSATFVEDFSRYDADQFLKKMLAHASAVSGVRNYEFGYMLSDASMKEGSNSPTTLLGLASYR
jgi:hypothetical protein